MKKPIYNFDAAQGFTTTYGETKNDIADALRDAALRITNAVWDEKHREELIYNLQCAAIDALDFFDCITEEIVK